MSDPDEPPVRRLPGRVFTMLCAAAVAFETAIIEPFQALANFGRLDLAEIYCARESKLTDMVIADGGTAERFSMWNGLDCRAETEATALPMVCTWIRPMVQH